MIKQIVLRLISVFLGIRKHCAVGFPKIGPIVQGNKG